MRRWVIAAFALLGALFVVTRSDATNDIISYAPKLQFFDNNGVECTGCLLFTYTAGSTSKLVTYTTSNGATANADPIVLNSRGEPPVGIWVPGGTAYKYVLSPANDTDPPTNPFYTVDNLYASTFVQLAGIGAGLGVDTNNNLYIPNGAITNAMLANPATTQAVTGPSGRLTLVTHTPVTVTTQNSKSTIYYDSYVGGTVPVAGTQLTITNNEVSLTLSSSEEATANIFDIFAVNSSGLVLCTPTNNAGSSGTGWAGDGGSNTARGSGYSQLDFATYPYPTNANVINHCFNSTTDYGPISANNATYLGSYYTTAAGQTGINFGSSASGGSAGFFYVWNYYYRAISTATVIDSGALYNYQTATTRQARASSGNEVSYIVGVIQDAVDAKYMAIGSPAGSSGELRWGIGIDSTTTFAGQYVDMEVVSGTFAFSQPAVYSGYPGLGLHTISANEKGDGTNANNWDNESLNTLYVTVRN